MRPLLAAVTCVVAGLVAGGIWTLAQPDRYRADARVLVRPPAVRPAVEALAESSLVEANVAQTLRLSSQPDFSAERGDGGVLTVSVEAGSRERARQVDAEALVILTQTVERRFDSSDVSVTVLDPAHAAEQTSPTPGRNLLITALIGLAAAAAVAGATFRRRTVSDPAARRRLARRIEEVSKRERALARRAGELAAREQAVGRRQPELVAASPTAEREDVAATTSEPESASIVSPSGWNLQALERLVQQQRPADPAAGEEWSAYLFFLREHADHDGTLPSTFDSLIVDVFGSIPGVLRRGDPADA